MLEAYQIAHALLLGLALAVAARAPRHRPLAAWLALSFGHALLSRYVTQPAFAGLPSPFHGVTRAAAHATHAAYLAVPAAFTAAVWTTYRRRHALLVPVAVAAAALAVIVVAYPAVRPSQVNPFAFATLAALDAVALVDARRARRLTADATDAAIGVFVFTGVVRVALPFWRAPGGAWASAPALFLLAYAIAAGVHVAALVAALRPRRWRRVVAPPPDVPPRAPAVDPADWPGDALAIPRLRLLALRRGASVARRCERYARELPEHARAVEAVLAAAMRSAPDDLVAAATVVDIARELVAAAASGDLLGTSASRQAAIASLDGSHRPAVLGVLDAIASLPRGDVYEVLMVARMLLEPAPAEPHAARDAAAWN